MTGRDWPALDVRREGEAAAHGWEPLQAALGAYEIAAIDESTPDLFRVYFAGHAERDRARRDLAGRFPALSVEPVDVEDGGWVEKSQADLRAVRVGNIIVAPPWDIPHTGRLTMDIVAERGGTPLRRPVVIVIRPSMGFGTGHHATTRLCLAALQHVNVRDLSAADVGTGSGILAIAMSRLGAARVVGIDDDPDALHAAEGNLSLNRSAEVSLRTADVRTIALDPVDLVTANLTGALLVDVAGRLSAIVAPAGRLILCGFTRDEEDAVRAAYAGFTVFNRSEEDEWVCVGLQRT